MSGAVADEIVAGLQQRPQAMVSPKFLYDRLGSALFNAITELPEYYPTRVEASIFAAQREAMAAAVHQRLPERFTLLDLGAGDGAKAAKLFASLKPAAYLAVDISESYLTQSLQRLQQQFPDLPMRGLALDFSQRLALPDGALAGPALVFYPGSSIGNFGPDEALRLLSEARQVSQGGALLIGADLIKQTGVLEAAYDDAVGVTAAFNLNLLRHVNQLLGSDFDVRQWQHRALFNTADSRIEMHLVARHDLVVRWPGGERRFAAGDSIHTESSYKWTPASFEALLRDAGWRGLQRWTDDAGWFGVFLAHA